MYILLMSVQNAAYETREPTRSRRDWATDPASRDCGTLRAPLCGTGSGTLGTYRKAAPTSAYNLDRKMVIDYLHKFGYLGWAKSPILLEEGVKTLQRNAGLKITGLINLDTISFVKTHPKAFSEGLIP